MFFEHLRRSLVLPCEVTGIEDFQWEEVYVIGPGSRKEYERLKKHQPSYRDRFELVALEMEAIRALSCSGMQMPFSIRSFSKAASQCS